MEKNSPAPKAPKSKRKFIFLAAVLVFFAALVSLYWYFAATGKKEGRYKTKNSFEDRQARSIKFLEKNSDLFPLVMENRNDFDSEEIFLLFPRTFNISQVKEHILSKLNLAAKDHHVSVYLGSGAKQLADDSQLKLIYPNHRDEDGNLYLEYLID